MPGPTRDPEQVGPYRIVGRLGAGGMGVVYAGVDAAGQRAAVKLIHDSHAADQEFRARFRREVAMLRRVRGAYCVRILADGADAAQPWLATEYIAGRTLTEHVAEHGPLRGDELYGLAAGLAEALTAVHAAGVVHRDLKPSNVMLSPDGPRLVDFGIARALDGTALTATGHVVGSPGWVSPEEYAGGPTGPAADVYGWALVVVYAATGRQPYGNERAEVLALRVLRNAVDTTALPPALRASADRALSKGPEQRPAMGEVLAAVATAWRGQPVAFGDAVADITDRVKRTWPSRTGSATPWPNADRPPAVGGATSWPPGATARPGAAGPSGQPATVPPRRRVKVVPIAAVATAAVLTGVILLNTLPGATTAQGPDTTQGPTTTGRPTSTTKRDATPATEPATPPRRHPRPVPRPTWPPPSTSRSVPPPRRDLLVRGRLHPERRHRRGLRPPAPRRRLRLRRLHHARQSRRRLRRGGLRHRGRRAVRGPAGRPSPGPGAEDGRQAVVRPAGRGHRGAVRHQGRRPEQHDLPGQGPYLLGWPAHHHGRRPAADPARLLAGRPGSGRRQVLHHVRADPRLPEPPCEIRAGVEGADGRERHVRIGLHHQVRQVAGERRDPQP
ncbi:serine/threonine-protein kinase [Nonomuraea salmonea]|uniref:serine/threonine-protein kinase n=1 Tax=Nonomuraea salmonea TaxID=46181 RepID=UPI0031F022F7